MSETERTKLRQLQIESELHPETHCLRSGTWVKNAEKTADELPLVGNSWIGRFLLYKIFQEDALFVEILCLKKMLMGVTFRLKKEDFLNVILRRNTSYLGIMGVT